MILCSSNFGFETPNAHRIVANFFIDGALDSDWRPLGSNSLRADKRWKYAVFAASRRYVPRLEHRAAHV